MRSDGDKDFGVDLMCIIFVSVWILVDFLVYGFLVSSFTNIGYTRQREKRILCVVLVVLISWLQLQIV